MLFGFGRRNYGCGCNQNMDPCRQNEVIEPTITKCVEKEFYHEVPQDYPFMSYELMINKYKLKSYYEIIFTFIITLFILIFHP